MVILDAVEYCRDYNVIFKVNKYTEVTVAMICIVTSAIAASKSGTQWTRPLRDLCAIFNVKNEVQLRNAMLSLEDQGILDIIGKTRGREYQPRMLDRSKNQIMINLDPVPSDEGKLLCSPRFDTFDTNVVTYAMIGFNDTLADPGVKSANVKPCIATSLKDSSLKSTWFAINGVKRIPEGTSWIGDDFWKVTTPEFLAPYVETENIQAPIPRWSNINKNFWELETTPITRDSMLNKALLAAIKDKQEEEDSPSIPRSKAEDCVNDSDIPAVVAVKTILDLKEKSASKKEKQRIVAELCSKSSYTLLETMLAINNCNLPQVLKDILADAYAFKYVYRE